ncbi:hypothetical protein ACIBP6_05440 [Nonomuraea terrae]|uniref:hypothetical protein n=1 Tax=Nonomuraea terrae TaxID=2530383 RepID=UPI0037A3D35B
MDAHAEREVPASAVVRAVREQLDELAARRARVRLVRWEMRRSSVKPCDVWRIVWEVEQH